VDGPPTSPEALPGHPRLQQPRTSTAIPFLSPIMSSRLSQVLSHLGVSSSSQPQQKHPPWYHPLNPTYFLPRAASIYGSSQAVQHRTSANIDITRTYNELSSRTAGLAYFFREECKLKRGDRVAIVSPNTPMFLESFYGIAGAGCISLTINCKLTSEGTDLFDMIDE
jgi:hypothetical protein